MYWSVFSRTSEFDRKNETILYSKNERNGWSSPAIASFSGEYADGGPCFSPDGKKLYFYSKRPTGTRTQSGTTAEIWFVERRGDDWSKAQHLPLQMEGEKIFLSMSSNYNIYFTSGHGPTGNGVGSVDLYCARYSNGAYAKPERLPDIVNSQQFVESDPLISPDEKYLLFYSLERPDNIGQYDLYVTHKDATDQWTKPVNLGARVNRGVSRFPRLSPDGKFLFFVQPDGVYWVDSSIVDDPVD